MKTQRATKQPKDRGFTLVEMMVVIIIVGILASVAVPLYTGYVQKSKITEATSIIGAVITSEKLEKQRTGCFYAADTSDVFKNRGLDLSDAHYFGYKVELSGTCPNDKFKVTATALTAFGGSGTIVYDYAAAITTPPEGSPCTEGRWLCTGDIDPSSIPEG